MKLYLNPNTDPRFNLALEEYLLETAKDPVCMLWRNARAVIIGKNQNAFTEVNLSYTDSNDIRVVRRLSGGGAVFHDVGNVNFTFITPVSSPDGLDFARFTDPILAILGELGVQAARSGRNDLVVYANGEERKISGNAQCVYTAADGRTPTLHHGTLLYDADLSVMERVLRVDPQKLHLRGIESVRSRVANLAQLLPPVHRDAFGDAEGFMRYLAASLAAHYETVVIAPEPEATRSAERLALEKYGTDAWNLRRMGDFAMTKSARFPFGRVEIRLDVREGRIAAAAIGGDFLGAHDILALTEALIGTDYSLPSVTGVLSDLHVGTYIHGATPDDIAGLICGEQQTDHER